MSETEMSEAEAEVKSEMSQAEMSEAETSESEMSEVENEMSKTEAEAEAEAYRLLADLEWRAERETESDVERERYRMRQWQHFSMEEEEGEDEIGEMPEVDENGSLLPFICQPEPQDPKSLDPLSNDTKFTEEEEIWSYLHTFSTATMNGFMYRLSGLRERKTKKSVYLCLIRPENSFNRSWMVVDVNHPRRVVSTARKVVSVSSFDDDMRNPKFDLSDSDLTSYGCTICGSKIYIAGGTCEGVPSNNIFVYDTNRKVWGTTILQMNVKRGENPTVVTADDKIFIFGGCLFDDAGAWGELYDPAAAAAAAAMPCQCLPPFPGTEIFNSDQIVSSKIISHAVHHNRNTIYLWLDAGFVLAYNYCNMLWAKYDKTDPIAKLPQLNNKVVVFEDILFWHNHGTIFASDLLHGGTVLMYTLPRTGFSKVLFGDEIVPSFLAHIGNGKLCLFFRSENHICYFMLLIQASQLPGMSIPLAFLGDSGILQNTLKCDIMHALEFSS